MEKQITWTVAAISEFAKAKALSVKQAFNYLSLFKGMDFLEKHYGAEHWLSFDDTVEDLTAICQRNQRRIVPIHSYSSRRWRSPDPDIYPIRTLIVGFLSQRKYSRSGIFSFF